MQPDMHCHLNHLDVDLDAIDSQVFAVTVSPADYLRAKKQLASCKNACVGLGMHPWWIAKGICGNEDIDAFCRLAAQEEWIGEIGLAFDKKWAGTEDAQLTALKRMLEALDDGKPRTISIHCRQGERQLLDLLEKTSLAKNSRVFLHCYTGPCDQLHRAIDMGCWFSVSVRMLSSKKGAEYAKLLPAERVMLETDACPNPFSFEPWDSVTWTGDVPAHDRMGPLSMEEWSKHLNAVAGMWGDREPRPTLTLGIGDRS